VSGAWTREITTAARAAGLDSATTEQATESLAKALGAASSLGDGGPAFVTAAKDAFVESMTTGMHVSVVVVLLALFVAWRFLPAHAADRQVTPEAEAHAAEALEELSVAAGD